MIGMAHRESWPQSCNSNCVAHEAASAYHLAILETKSALPVSDHLSTNMIQVTDPTLVSQEASLEDNKPIIAGCRIPA